MNNEKDKNSSYLPRSWGAGTTHKKENLSLDDPSDSAVSQRNATDSRDICHGYNQKAAKETGDVEEDADLMALEDDFSEIEQEQNEDLFVSGELQPNQVQSSDIQAPDHQTVRVPVNVVGVRFGYACKIYHFDAGDLDLAVGDWVVVKTEKGLGLGNIAIAPTKKELDTAQLEGLRKVLRKATKADFDCKERCIQKETEAYAYCLERIEALELPMKLVAVECFFDGSKYVFYFTAEGRVDFRELVKQLVARFPVRIEMRQIGVRHESKMLGGIACCGQELCCSRFLTDFRPVSVKMAKNQNLSLNPSKISGVCGRLMCCLSYEHDTYEEFKKGLPKVGKTVSTTKGDGVVVKHNPLTETVFVRFDDETIVEILKEDIIKEVDSASQKKLCTNEPDCAELQERIDTD